MNNEYKKATGVIRAGGIVVIPTDTIYGVVGDALNKETVERIYRLKGRPPEKPFIILISNLNQLNRFGAKLSEELNKYWPGPVSIILEIKSNLEYLHRETNALAFRMPDKPELLKLIEETGPIVAPSANISAMEPAKNINEAKNYFGEAVDYYIDEGDLNRKPSALIKIVDDKVKYLRK